MKFRHPERKKFNLFMLLPVAMLVLAIAFTIHSAYLYFSGTEEEILWLGIGAAAVVYFSFRTWFAAKQVFIIGDE